MEKKSIHRSKGFTLAELLIVVAIIAVLVAIAIPVFKAQREKAIIAVNKANIRAAAGAVTAQFYQDDMTTNSMQTNNYTMESAYYIYDIESGTITPKRFLSYSDANNEARTVSQQAARKEKISKVYVYVGQSDKGGRESIGKLGVETAPHYKGDEVVNPNSGNPFGVTE